MTSRISIPHLAIEVPPFNGDIDSRGHVIYAEGIHCCRRLSDNLEPAAHLPIANMASLSLLPGA